MSEGKVLLFNTMKDHVFSVILETYDIPSKEALLSKNRKGPYPEARYMLMRGLKTIGISEKEIFIETRRDRTTYIHAKKTVNNWLETDSNFRKKLLAMDRIFDQIKNDFRRDFITGNDVVSTEKSGNTVLLVFSVDKNVLLEFSGWMTQQSKNSLTAGVREFLKNVVDSIES